ncbi:hypothetical protein C882_3589 [Caenispirillum salinarum AK4]|uniref:Transmembrane protein n=1 Tax=Caenispirillum salinarum AK4 TaxID=1238182 RepID=K9H2M6_9PROT|nr:PGPGW domain-containing protein [Caenispirillum salinarum]EKV31837.1 hypothetical protein C882_3589 [Caenispirillum salinarum AK4]
MTLAEKLRRLRPSGAAGGMVRGLWLGAGCVLILVGVIISPIPGPLGTPLVLAGLLIVLRTSLWARRRYVRLSRRWPGPFRLTDRLLRRRRRRRRRRGLPVESGAAA